jgi:hypothetical protein
MRIFHHIMNGFLINVLRDINTTNNTHKISLSDTQAYQMQHSFVVHATDFTFSAVGCSSPLSVELT